MDSEDNEFLCECFNVATHYCPTHDLYLCRDELKQHKCKVKPLGKQNNSRPNTPDTSFFNLKTQKIKPGSENTKEFFSGLKSEINTSLESAEKIIEKFKGENKSQVARAHELLTQSPIHEEVASIQSFFLSVSGMIADVSNYLIMSEQYYKTQTSTNSNINSFLSKMIENLSINIGLLDKKIESIEDDHDDTNFVKMEYTMSHKEGQNNTNLNSAEFMISERVVEISEFVGPFKKTSVKPMEDAILENDFSFSMDDYDLVHTENFKDKFEESHSKLCRILDQALHDINCPEFYNKGFIESVNEYFDEFKGVLDIVLKELKNNFNKL